MRADHLNQGLGCFEGWDAVASPLGQRIAIELPQACEGDDHGRDWEKDFSSYCVPSERGSTWLWRIIRVKEAAEISNVTPPTFARFHCECAVQCSISMQLAEFGFPPPGAVQCEATVAGIQKCSIANDRVVRYYTHLAHAFDSLRLGTQWLHGWSIPGWRQPEDIVDKDGDRDGGGDLRPGLSLPRLSGPWADRNIYRPSPRLVAWTYKVGMLPVVMICGGGGICGKCGVFFLSILIIPGDCADRASQRKTLFNSSHLITFRRLLITNLWLFGGNNPPRPIRSWLWVLSIFG